MSDQKAPDLGLVVRLLKQFGTEQRAMRDDLTVPSAMLARLNHGMSALTDEVRAMHSQHTRFGHRLRELETTVNEKLAP